MSRVHVSISIAKPRREVYEFVAKPRLWPQWLSERVRLAQAKSGAAWKVTAREAPRRWAMQARVAAVDARLELRFKPQGKATLCECEIEYRGVNPLLDVLHVQPKIRREASRSLNALKEVLESSACTRSRAASG